MRPFHSILVVLLPGCSFFMSPESQMQSLAEDCVSNYEGWAEDIKDADEDDALDIFNDIMKWEHASERDFKQAQYELWGKMLEMEEKEREDVHADLIDRLEDPYEDCSKAREDWREELADNEDACEAYFDWEEELDDEWEGFFEEVSDRREDCSGKDICFEIKHAGEGNLRVRGPEDIGRKEDCDD